MTLAPKVGLIRCRNSARNYCDANNNNNKFLRNGKRESSARPSIEGPDWRFIARREFSFFVIHVTCICLLLNEVRV